MFHSASLTSNSNGHLTIGGVDTLALAAQYTTPLYVMDEDVIRASCLQFREAMKRCYGERGHVAFASKSFCCMEMCRIAHSEELYLDVVSAGELHTALKAGFPAARIIFHGNNKSLEELTMAVETNVGRIVVDNIIELEVLNRLAAHAEKTVDILLRIKPGISVHTHSAVITGNIDSKFGFALETGEAIHAVAAAVASKNLRLKGLHSHIGSQIFDSLPFERAAQIMVDFLGKIRLEFTIELNELNFGGGFGIRYTDTDSPMPPASCIQRVSEAVKSACHKNGIHALDVFIEPGRAIVGAAGITLYTVGAVKEIPEVRTYVSVDGGMADNPRYALYKSSYEVVVANRADAPQSGVVTIAGRCCESGDLIGEEIALQNVQVGDILAVLSTGAYNYSMASNYNRLQKPAVVMVKNQTSRVIVKRQTLEELVLDDI